MTSYGRPVWAAIDLEAVRHNVQVLGNATSSPIMAVVKADAYGHGAVAVSRAALDAGVQRLAVALVEEASELRRAGIEAPIHLLSEPPLEAARDVVALGLTPAAYSPKWIDVLAKAAADVGADVPVHLKIDTGMHRVGAAPADAVDLGRRIDAAEGLILEGVWTHLAVADEPDDPATAGALGLFDETLERLQAGGVHAPLVHAANSAAALSVPAARYDLVRLGISLYGILPMPRFEPDPGLHPVMSLHARISYVKRLPKGERVSYGLTYEIQNDANVATVPVGYADGYSRRLSNRAQALVRGKRVRVAGAVTMDQILLDCGDLPVEEGDDVALIGVQDGESISANDLAEQCGTIGYEIVCAVGKRVPRVFR